MLSPTSGRIDHGVKLREYRAVASIRCYVIVDNTGPDVEVYARPAADLDWTATSVTAGDVLALPEVGIELPVDEIFRGIKFEAEES